MTKSRKAENEQKRRRWQKILKNWKESGKTQSAYCREYGLSYHQFQYWMKRQRFMTIPGFIELRPENACHEKAHPPLQLIVGGCQVAIERDFDPVALQQLIGILARL